MLNLIEPFYLRVICAACNGIVMCLAAKKFYLFLQLNSYYPQRGYLKIVKTREFLFGATITAFAACVCILSYVFSLFVYTLMSIFLTIKNIKTKTKVKLKYTKRIKRLHFTVFLLIALFNVYFNLIFAPLLLVMFVLLAFYINLPIEHLINSYYIRKAKKKLNSAPNLIKIAVVGSWGKTSVKQILQHLLKSSFSVLSTPGSYNTPLGISSVINNSLVKDTQILIAEMGAKRRGDIKYLTKMISPDIAIITGVGNQHLETFKSQANIEKAKFEVCENMDSGALCVFNADNAVSAKYAEKTATRVLRVSLNQKADCYAEILKVSEGGTNFNVHIESKLYNCTTKLLGRHNVLNIMLAAAVAHALGVGFDSIVENIATIPPIKHRLELLDSSNGIIVIDDSYNANSEGVKHALDVLQMLKCGKRIVVTPGIVELGDMQFSYNFTYGEQLSQVCDCVILVGTQNKKAISDGLEHGGFPRHRLYEATSLIEASETLKSLIQSGDAVLFANDLPDNFI